MHLSITGGARTDANPGRSSVIYPILASVTRGHQEAFWVHALCSCFGSHISAGSGRNVEGVTHWLCKCFAPRGRLIGRLISCCVLPS